MADNVTSAITERLPAHIRVTYTLFMTEDATGLEMSVAIKDLPVHVAFPRDGNAADVASAVGLKPGHFDNWRFMTAEETTDYLKRRKAGEIDDLEEEV